jgi:uncharacterized Tic20 family protein
LVKELKFSLILGVLSFISIFYYSILGPPVGFILGILGVFLSVLKINNKFSVSCVVVNFIAILCNVGYLIYELLHFRSID